MFCCTFLYVHSSIAIILMGNRELIALLNLSSWCLVMVERLFLTVPWGCLQFVIVVFPDHTHLLYLAAITIGVNLSHLHQLKTIKSCQDIMCAINWSEQMAYEFNTNYKQLSHSIIECLQ